MRDLRIRHGMLAVAASWFGMGLPPGLFPLEEERFGIHAGDMETSVMLAMIAYAAAAGDEWEKAREQIRAFLGPGGRENAARLGMGLLEAGVALHQGATDEAGQLLAGFIRDVRNPWYVSIAEYLSGRISEESLKASAEKSPEQLVTAYTSMGFRAEAARDRNGAMHYYKQALGSFMDDWLEYDFASERLKRLRRSPE